MLLAVGLQVAGAVFLKLLADARHSQTASLLLLGVVAVVVLNVIRLAVWALAHHRFPLSSTFPLSSLFYPAMLLVAMGFGDEIGIRQIGGALLITAGALWLTIKGRT